MKVSVFSGGEGLLHLCCSTHLYSDGTNRWYSQRTLLYPSRSGCLSLRDWILWEVFQVNCSFSAADCTSKTPVTMLEIQIIIQSTEYSGDVIFLTGLQLVLQKSIISTPQLPAPWVRWYPAPQPKSHPNLGDWINSLAFRVLKADKSNPALNVPPKKTQFFKNRKYLYNRKFGI